MLKSALLRLAHAQPELRKDLLGIIRMAATLNGDPDSASIYPNKINHGYDQPLAGGTDVMKRLQDKLLHEQGRPEREKNPKIGSTQRVAQAFLKTRA
jgi:hypothetical protein